MKGIDISSYQGHIDFNRVKNTGVEVVFMKTTEGRTYIDPTIDEHYQGALDAGLKIGYYHFLRNNETQDEINNFLNTLGNKKIDCKIAIDMETDFGSVYQNTKRVRDFADALKSKGYEVILYTYSYFYNHNLDMSQLSDLPVWIAEYSGNAKPSILGSYVGYQYSDKGQVDGISGNVDMNEFSDGILVGGNVAIDNGTSNIVQPSSADLAQQLLSNKVARAREFFKGDVLQLQKDLNRVMGTHIAEDNLFYFQTYGLVKSFQAKYSLVVDGLMGDASMAKLNQLISDMNRPQGDPEISRKQKLINRLLSFSIAEDGIAGNQTINAIKQLQEVLGITQDGAWGNFTEECVNQILSKPTLQVGSKGIPVHFVQYRIGTNADGDYGNGTANKVREWQSSHGLSADGIFGQMSWSKLIG